MPGTPYRLAELIGSGGFGAVYRAVSPTLQHLPLAIKFCLDRSLLPALNQERSNLERLMRAGGRGSGHVVRLYGYDLDHATPYLVYEYVSGGDLTRLVAARRAALGRAPDPAEVFGWVNQIADGLAFAHRTGLVHRDLKPANVLFDAEDRAKIADFGIARMGNSGTLTEAGTVLGTASYISPEQAAGRAAGPPSDVYSFGVILFRMLTGRLPFESRNAMDLVRMHRDSEPPPISVFRPDAPARLESVAAAALAKDPAGRPRDGSALLSELVNAS